jgi:hypothetical protein
MLYLILCNFLLAFEQEDWNGNLVEDVSDLGDFESCSSSIPEDKSGNSELEDSPFFRNRSSSESAVMGNKSSSHKAKGRLVLNPRCGTETEKEPNLPFQNELPNNSGSSSTLSDDRTRDQQEQKQNIYPQSLSKVFIGKSTTSETLYADVDEPEEDPSSYQDVAHHHTWTCDENLLIVSETSDSINVPDLPLDSNNETCSLREVSEFENAGTVSLSSGFEQPTSDNIELDADTSSYATELCSRSNEIEQLQIKDNFQQFDKKFFAKHEKNSCQVTLQQHLVRGQLNYLSLEVPSLIFHYAAAAKYHIFKIYAVKNKSVSF